jgi:hypothetical protein
MDRSLMWIVTAALFASVLSGPGSQGKSVGMTVPREANGPAGKGMASASPGHKPQHHRFKAILHAPSAFNCLGDRASGDVFQQQCESSIGN